MLINQVTTLEIEVTSKCNARCPQCVRNYYGSYTWPSLPIVNIDLNILKNSISDSTLKNLKRVRLCGTYGDPCMNTELLDIITWVKSLTDASIIINTNGGIRSKKWWQELAGILNPNKDRVVFGIDGLEDTNHLYRIGVNYSKVIKNLKAFNQAGGKSVWQFLVFKHNQHQVETAKKTSEELGCIEFGYKLTSRFVDKTHTFINKTPVMGDNGHPIYFLEPSDGIYKNQGYDDIPNIIKEFNGYENYLKNTKINCQAKKLQTVTISVEGDVFPCGWLADRMYGYEPESHPDHKKIKDLIDSIGGRENINLKYTSFESIIKGPWFQAIENSWSTNSIERCANQCGSKSRLVALASAGQFKNFIEPN